MNGWKTYFSKSQQKNYFLHTESGRKSWDPPDETIENALIRIKKFFHSTKMISDDSDGFLNCMRETLIHESSTDLVNDSERGEKFSVLDIGCNIGKDIRLWNSLGCSVYYGFDNCTDAVKSIAHLNLHGLSTKVCVTINDAASEDAWTYKDIDLAVSFHTFDYAFSSRLVFKSIFKSLVDSLSRRGRILIIYREAQGSDFDINNVSSSDGECPSFALNKDTLKKESLENLLEVVVDENIAVLAAWMGFNSPITTEERSFMYYGTHKKTLLKWCKTETPSGISWMHATKHRFALLRKNCTVGNTIRDSIAVWKARLKSGTLGELI